MLFVPALGHSQPFTPGLGRDVGAPWGKASCFGPTGVGAAGDGGLGWALDELPGIVLGHSLGSCPSQWQRGLGQSFGAPASTGHILPKTDPVLIQNLASVWSQEGKRRERGPFLFSGYLSPPQCHLLHHVLPLPPHPRVVFYPFNCAKILPLM